MPRRAGRGKWGFGMQDDGGQEELVE